MPVTSNQFIPKLRPIDIRPITHAGQPALLLRDPLQISERVLIVPQPLAPVLLLCDGTHDLVSLRANLGLRYGLFLSLDEIEQIVAALDEALLLENDTFATARGELLAAYRAAPFRPPALAGHAYPADASDLRQLCDAYLADLPAQHQRVTPCRGLLSPHIDYARGGSIYAATWQAAAEQVRDAELIVIFATDHYGGNTGLTLTRQHYATPYGVLPTAVDVVDAVAEAIGETAAFEHEVLHRREHAVELPAVWLHHLREGKPCELVPILVGPFAPFVHHEADPAAEPAFRAAIEALHRATGGRRMLVVASGDMAHVGPAFGGAALNATDKAALRTYDEQLVDHLCRGDAHAFFDAIRRVGDRTNICGLPPVFLMLQLLGATEGTAVGYAQCPADESDTSLVSIAGIVFR